MASQVPGSTRLGGSTISRAVLIDANRAHPAGERRNASSISGSARKRIRQSPLFLFDNAVIKARTNGLGVIREEWIDPFGIVGTNARCTGSSRDVRKDYPYLVYDRLDFDAITGDLADVYGRSLLRRDEILMACDLVRQMLREMPEGPVRTKLPNPLHSG